MLSKRIINPELWGLPLLSFTRGLWVNQILNFFV